MLSIGKQGGHPLETDRQTDGRHIVPKTPYSYSIAVARQKLIDY